MTSLSSLSLCKPGIELNVFLGQDGAVQQKENPLGGDTDSLHQRGDSFLHASLQISLKLDEFLKIFQIKDKKSVSGGYFGLVRYLPQSPGHLVKILTNLSVPGPI